MVKEKCFPALDTNILICSPFFSLTAFSQTALVWVYFQNKKKLKATSFGMEYVIGIAY